MEDTFQISDPAQDPATGDYLTFTIDDNGQKVAGRVSNTVIAELKKGRAMEDVAAFKEGREAIRAAAYRKRRVNPGLDLIVVSTYDM